MSQFVLPYPFLGRSPFVTTRRFLIALITITLATLAFSFDFAPQVSTITPNRMIFVPNRGQTDASVQFLAHQGSNRWLFTQDEMIYSWVTQENEVETLTSTPTSLPQFHTGTLRQQFLGVNEDARFAAAEPLIGTVNYLLGKDATHWLTNLPTYAAVHSEAYYSGVDIAYTNQVSGLGIQFLVHPGASIDQVRWQYPDAVFASINEKGELSLTLPDMTEVVIPALTAYQTINGRIVPLSIRYIQLADGTISWQVGDYDLNSALVITQLVTSSYAYDRIQDIFVDNQGSTYVVGLTSSTDFPLINPLQSTTAGPFDAFISRFSLDGTDLIYSTFFGGAGADIAGSISVDTSGNMYIMGSTDSPDFPVLNPWQSTYHGVADVFIVKLAPDGNSMAFSTYFGGNDVDVPSQIINDDVGNVYFAGVTRSCDFPLHNPLQNICPGNEDAFVSKLSATGQNLLFSTYLGGSNYDAVNSLTIDDQHNVYVTGETRSSDFPLVNPLQNARSGISDALVSKISADGQTLVYSTFLGGNTSETAYNLAVLNNGAVVVTGITASNDFPIVNPLQNTHHGNNDMFVSQLNTLGNSLVYSTYLGGSDTDAGMDVVVDDEGNIYLTGTTYSMDFPVVNAVQPTSGGYQDTVVAKLNAAGSALVFSTYVGGESSEFVSSVAVDEANNVYVAGETWSTAFPTTPGAWQENYAGGGDGFVTKILADGSAFGYSTYLGGGFPTDVTVTDVRGVAYDGWLTGLFTSGVVYLVIGYWVWRYRRGRKGIV